MKLSDYIVQFFIEKGITDVFGYPGGSVTNLMDSLKKREEEINAHVVYHEQAAAFSACSYAVVAEVPGVAYATGGPGATNLVTGIGHAYYESIPVIFITGNVNTYEEKLNSEMRQRAFQESDIVSVVSTLTKFSVHIKKEQDIKYYLEKAYFMAMEGRKGPVLLDIPMNIQRADIEIDSLRGYNEEYNIEYDKEKNFKNVITELLTNANHPCIILGNGAKNQTTSALASQVINKFKIPYVTSMIAFDIIGNNKYYFGFLGAYGMRQANFIAAKSDLVISIGSRLDIRQVGVKREEFAQNAKIVRIDIDKSELSYKVHSDEISFFLSAQRALELMLEIDIEKDYSRWMEVCKQIRNELCGYDDKLPNEYIHEISKLIPENSIITTDVGQNQVWVAQSFQLKNGQKILFSGGMGAMGYALPAAIGAYYGRKKTIVCICGDGGLQMNIQELQYLVREKIPVKIFVINNNALGMIRHFQEMYFNGCYFQTTPQGGFTSPDFGKIAEAYGIEHRAICSSIEVKECKDLIESDLPALIEIIINENTYIIPKLEFGQPNQDQWPKLNRELYKKLNELK